MCMSKERKELWRNISQCTDFKRISRYNINYNYYNIRVGDDSVFNFKDCCDVVACVGSLDCDYKYSS